MVFIVGDWQNNLWFLFSLPLMGIPGAQEFGSRFLPDLVIGFKDHQLETLDPWSLACLTPLLQAMASATKVLRQNIVAFIAFIACSQELCVGLVNNSISWSGMWPLVNCFIHIDLDRLCWWGFHLTSFFSLTIFEWISQKSSRTTLLTQPFAPASNLV